MWYFNSPQIVFGEDALEALDDIQGQRAFIVTDPTIVRLGIVDKVRSHLTRAGLDICVFDAVESDPSLYTVQRGAQEARVFQPDWIIGLGGGSPMDAAKAIWVIYERPDLTPAEINPLIQLNLRKKARLITIPTTSGTGAEVTWAIVLTDTDSQRKLGLGNRENTPDIAIVDPSLAADMPAQLTADTGLDALTHAVEGYTCAWHTDLTDGLCLAAIRLIFHWLPRAVADRTDMEARERMHNAATCAGLGFGNSMASMAHAMGHALGATFHLPHGRAVALCLPYTIEFAASQEPHRYAELAALIMPCDPDPYLAARAFAARIRELCRQVGVPTSLAQVGIPRNALEASLEKIIDDSFNDSQMLTAVRSPSYEELKRLFWYLYEGREVDF